MKKTSRYQEKRRLGLVPHRYDKDSRSFNLGAHKNWTGVPEWRQKTLALLETASRNRPC